MPKTAPLTEQLDRLAAFEPGPYPVISLYLDLRPNERGRDNFEPFLRNELGERIRTYEASGPERASLDSDAERIREYVGNGLDGSLNGLAIFASNGASLFEAIPLQAPVGDHRLVISDQPHLYPLARLADEYPRYAIAVVDTHQARIFVVAANAVEKSDTIENQKTRSHKMGGWSQARYQRRVENFHQQHAKDVVEALARLVRDEQIEQVILAGDEVIVPLLRAEMPKELADRVVDIVKLDIRASQRDILDKTIGAMREKDAETDRERVDALIGAYRSGGLGCAGVDATRRAFELGQVEELIIAASVDDAPWADELIASARQTAARVRFIEDASLLEPIGRVGSFLRFKL